MSLDFQPLSKDRLTEALSLIGTVFPDDLSKVEKVYDVSLENDKSDEYWKTRRLLDYWMVIDSADNKLVALTGFYQLFEHPEDEIWLGWYCVDPLKRGQGIGRKTLEWTIAEARKRGYKVLKLWTTTDPNEAAAQKLYDSVGLEVSNEEFDEESGYTKMFRRLNL